MNRELCLINVAHEHFITQTGKKSKPALINFMRPGPEGKQIPIVIISLFSVDNLQNRIYMYIYSKNSSVLANLSQLS